MLKSGSPTKIEEKASSSAKARFFYAGVFALLRRKEELSQPRSAKNSQEKKIKK
jgi:hypothetical protein